MLSIRYYCIPYYLRDQAIFGFFFYKLTYPLVRSVIQVYVHDESPALTEGGVD